MKRVSSERKTKAFLLRIDRAMLDALESWADEELRSLNAQIQWVLRAALKKRGKKVRSK